MDKYTAFQAHHSDVRQLQSTMRGVVSLSEDEIRLTSRTGQPLLSVTDPDVLKDMNTSLCLDDGTLLVGCQGNKMATVDLSQGKISEEVRWEATLKPGSQYDTSQVFT